MEMRYFDCNATTPLCVEARAAWNRANDDLWLNPSSPYRAAARVHAHLEAARSELATLLGVESQRVVFNSGATEGNNAIFAYWSASLPAGARIGVSPTEHPSVIESAQCYFGDRVEWLALDRNGAVALEAINWDELAAVSVMAANHETGVMNPWQAIAHAAQAAGVAYHCDASQWVGKQPLAGLAACAYLTACAHKFGGPRGVGFWLLPADESGFACFAGGGQESGRRAGTENVAGIMAMVAALAAARVGESTGRDAFLAALPEFECVGQGAARLWNTALLLAPEFASNRWIRALEKRGYWLSSGAACATAKAGPSTVLAAMGISDAAMRRSLRISSSAATTPQEWAELATELRAVYAELRAEEEASGSSVVTI